MPLVGFRPTKARLVMENGKESVLVMKVVLDDDDAVELAAGGSLGDMTGVLRIRERRGNGNGNGAIGSMVFVAESGRDAQASPAKFQLNVNMAAEKFATLLRVANAGRLPTKFFVDAGERKGPEAKALGYRMRSGVRVKVWDNHAFRVLPITNFVMILPMEVPAAGAGVAPATFEAGTPVALATNAQVSELMDDMLVFQSDTRNTMFGLVCVLGIVALSALAIGLAVFFR
ncbi:MAG TPA: hypothetical protein VMN56_06050 [Casimicrobiaceae bacterium]|nr:hypothetical protein [Casimicrobiaceae bacterium]